MLPSFADLDREFGRFARARDAREGEPFHNKDGGVPHWSSSITSFLCTAVARDLFKRGEAMLTDPVQHGTFDGTMRAGPQAADRSTPLRRPLTSAEVQSETADFLDYARRKGLWGTPHNL